MNRILFAAKHVLDGTTHEQTIICRQLFVDHVVGSRSMERTEKEHRMIIVILGHQLLSLVIYSAVQINVVE